MKELLTSLCVDFRGASQVLAFGRSLVESALQAQHDWQDWDEYSVILACQLCRCWAAAGLH